MLQLVPSYLKAIQCHTKKPHTNSFFSANDDVSLTLII